MTFLSIAFDYHDTQYIRLGKVLEKSIKINCPKSEIIYHICPAPKVPEHERADKRFGENTEKLKLWVEFLNKIQDDNIVLIDADTMVLSDISGVFKDKFDIGVTRRTKDGRIKYNGGVMFVKKNERSLAFFQKFKEINDLMYQKRNFHAEWRQKYSGMNQAAFGWMTENYRGNIIMREYPCSVYNAVSDDWGAFDINKTKIVHLKSKLREACLHKGNRYQSIVNIFNKIERL